jgi:hypothetical protein
MVQSDGETSVVHLFQETTKSELELTITPLSIIVVGQLLGFLERARTSRPMRFSLTYNWM